MIADWAGSSNFDGLGVHVPPSNRLDEDLAVLGAVGAKTGGAGLLKPTLRVTFWGAFAMALTAGIGAIFGKAI